MRHIKKENETKQLELENTETKLKKIQDEIEKCDELMKPIKERLMKIQSIEREVSTLMAKKIELTTKYVYLIFFYSFNLIVWVA